jgi:uncharacterized membrane protein YkvA (DUF1232 family)
MRFTKTSIAETLKCIGRAFRSMGQQLVYSVYLMIGAYKRKDAPGWAKRIIIGGLGYLLTPIDAVPDLSPIIGYTDDLGVLSFGLVAIASYINNDVRIQARRAVKTLFGEVDFESLHAVDERL